MTGATARPSYVIIPIEDYLQHQYQSMPQQQHHQLIPVYRTRRSADFEEDQPPQQSRGQPIYDPVASASDHHHHADDHVDYGAYTGGYGAFGWYSDHPVHVQTHHRRR